MKQTELEALLLAEIHREIVIAAQRAVTKLGSPVPVEARADYLSAADLETLRTVSPTDFEHPLVSKSMTAIAARVRSLSYPPDGTISKADAEAIESLKLSDAQRQVVERVVAEACQSAFFHFFCILDAVGDPQLAEVGQWRGARFVYGRKEGPMLHDEFGDAYYAYRKRSEV